MNHLRKKRKKEYEKTKERSTKILNFKKKIKKYNNLIWCPNYKLKYKNKSKNTWFKINVAKSKIKRKLDIKIKSNFENEAIKCKRIILNFSFEQKAIIHNWFASYALMYNETLKLIRARYINKESTILNFKLLRTKYLKNIKKNIMNFYENKRMAIKSHSLDYAIKLACSNYKSALTNYKKGHIKHFRIRYWRHNRKNKIIDLEDACFGKKGLCFNTFGKILAKYDKKPFDLSMITKTSKLQYNYTDNKYYLFVPEDIKCKKIKKKATMVACDPGIRTFMTGISENKVIKIGEDCGNKIKEYLAIIDRRNNMDISKKIKKKNEQTYNRKINNLVNELHWKSIKYLTDSFKQILIGDMSVQGISKKGSNINKMTKRIAYRLKFFNFKQRLEYKCKVTKTEYREIDESFTSKMCSLCGFLKEDLGGSKIFKCNGCHKKIDRDVNGARGIFIKSI